MGLIQVWANLARHAPHLANSVLRFEPLASIGKRWAGITTQRELPSFAPETFTVWVRHRKASPKGGRKVLLWPDTFTNHFEPAVAKAAMQVLEAADCSVSVPETAVCCGRPLYEYGMLGRARDYARRNLEILRREIRAETPLIVLEPSCLSVFKDEMVSLFPDDPGATKLAQNCYSFSDFLTNEMDYHPPSLNKAALTHGDCHQKAFDGIESELRLLQRAGVRAEALDSGCCGLAGSYGYEADRYDISMKIAEHVLLPKVRESGPDSLIVSSGFSCRSQIAHGSGRAALHPAQVIQMALRRNGAAVLELPERQQKKRRMASGSTASIAAGIAVTAAIAGLAVLRYQHSARLG